MKRIVVLCLVLISSQSFGWGKIGHRVVGEISDSYLSTKAKLEIKKLLMNETLAQVSVWPDFIKSNKELRDKYNHYHYMNLEKGDSIEKRSYINKKGDILSAISLFTKQLRNKKNFVEDRVIALKFLVHLIGDIHQPLHVAKKSDKGGNDIELSWFGKKTNLHAVWDDHLIQMEELSYTEYTKLINHASQKEIKEWQMSDAKIWAEESNSYLDKVYKYRVEKYWEYSYSYDHIKYLNSRLLKAGVRLAGHLNNVFQ